MSTQALQIDPAIIERVVREVVARLRDGTAAKAPHDCGCGGPKHACACQQHEHAASPKILILAQPVITAADLAGKLAGIEQLHVPPRTVITPSARDLLREAKVAVAHSSGESKTAAGNQALAVVIGQAKTDWDVAPLASALRQRKLQVEQLARTGLTDTLAALADEAALGGKLAVLATTSVATAVCLANRRRGVRAAALAAELDAAEMIENLGANVLVVDPRGRATYELARMIEQVATWTGQRGCPKLLAALEK